MTELAVPEIKNLKLFSRGKVRDIYEVDEGHLLMVTTDRVSAFDVILPDRIPGKGVVLNTVTKIWKKHFEYCIPNDSARITVESVLAEEGFSAAELGYFKDRSVVVKKLKPLPVEAIVRGYITGSGWKDYLKTGKVCGHVLPEGLQEAQKLHEVLYTPSTKAAVGKHDENIDFDATVSLLGADIADKVRGVSRYLYFKAHKMAYEKGIIIADTKFEFGLDEEGELHLIDEVLTPDSSRFWPADQYQVGVNPPSLDKQFIRDYLETIDWNKKVPGPSLPESIKSKTIPTYLEVLKVIKSL